MFWIFLHSKKIVRDDRIKIWGHRVRCQCHYAETALKCGGVQYSRHRVKLFTSFLNHDHLKVVRIVNFKYS